MGASSDKEALASPGNFFLGRKRRVPELFAELLGRSFLPFPNFAAVDYHAMRVALALDLDLTARSISKAMIASFAFTMKRQRDRGARAQGDFVAP
jgi:hypothetical protein